MFLALFVLAFPLVVATSQVVPPTSPPPQPLPQPPPKSASLIPDKLTASPGQPIVIDASAAKGKVKWRFDFDPKNVISDGKKLYFSTAVNGVYRITLISWDDQSDGACEITVGEVVRPKPSPTPVDLALQKLQDDVTSILGKLDVQDARITKLENGGGPPVVVVDAFQAAVQAAYVADGKPAAAAASLAAVYRQSGATVANSAKMSEVLGTMHIAAQTLIADQLPTVRRVIADELNAQLGKTDKALDAATRSLINAQFIRAQKALEALR